MQLIKSGDFTSLANDFLQYCQVYCLSIINALVELLCKPVGVDFVDVGASARNLTRLVHAADVLFVTVVEPNNDVRQNGMADGQCELPSFPRAYVARRKE